MTPSTFNIRNVRVPTPSLQMGGSFCGLPDHPPLRRSSLEQFILPENLEPHGLHDVDPSLHPAPMRLLHQGPVVPIT